MEQVKTLTNAIDQATSDMQNGPNHELYAQVEKLTNARADMPKFCVAHISKRLMIKNDKVTYLAIDLMEYIMYNTELPFWNQLCTNEFLLKLSQILQSKDPSTNVHQRILMFVRCEFELFKPHQDLLPHFFKFYESMSKKGYDQKPNYVSPYRPMELKKYPTKAETKLQPRPSATQSKPQQSHSTQKEIPQHTMAGMRERIVLTNDIIDGCNPVEQVKNNNLLIEMLTSLKEIEKKLNNLIGQDCDEKTMEEAIALNDDLVITFRRFKDLQTHKKPEPFIKTELASNYIVKEEVPRDKRKKEKSVFDQFDLNEPPAGMASKKEPKQQLDIFGLGEEKSERPVETKANTKKGSFNIFEMDDSEPPRQPLGTNNPPLMNTLSSVQMNMGTMSTPMQNINAYNSGLLGLSMPTMPPTSSPSVEKPAPFGFNSSPPKPESPFKFGDITTNNSLFGISLNTGSVLNYNNEFATEAVKVGSYTESDLTDLSDLFSKKL